jgi:hypothetical protein
MFVSYGGIGKGLLQNRSQDHGVVLTVLVRRRPVK